MDAPHLTVLNLYRLKASAEAFTFAITALANRVEREGERGLLSYRFWVNEADGTARAVIDYATPQAWIGHHDISMGWPEMKALHTVAALEDVTFLGPLTPEIRTWLTGSSLTAKVHDGFAPAAGFRRT
ncbi:MAG: hypothetical protein U1E69_03190 [Tabrizicola sp.]|uniref:hypothetical protein n=1 Tax=Tabrizicola sp. TaxID=2005166 RepID=UPI002AB951A0|nr:hypothetical protein [Tabrizicola sp.]MDZ4085787.1 hypothetical protein [Tabrizicola sp.]